MLFITNKVLFKVIFKNGKDFTINNQKLIFTSGVSICNELNLPDITLVFDEALYAKVQMIRWGNDFLKKKLVIRLGDFHCCMSFLSGIAKIFQHAGLQVRYLRGYFTSFFILSVRPLYCPNYRLAVGLSEYHVFIFKDVKNIETGLEIVTTTIHCPFSGYPC